MNARYELPRPYCLIALVIFATSTLVNGGIARAAPMHTRRGDVAFELIGQELNPSPTTSMQYGFLSQIDGLALDSIFSASPHGEGTALFTFFTEATNTQVINDGQLRIVNRTGVTTIYNDPSHGDFSNSDSFKDGTPILTAALKQQVILDTFEGTFTATNINTVTSASPFSVGNDQFQLAETGAQFRTSINGRTTPTPTPAGFVIAGHAVAIEPVPEPTALALLAAGAIGLLGFRGSRWRRSARAGIRGFAEKCRVST